MEISSFLFLEDNSDFFSFAPVPETSSKSFSSSLKYRKMDDFDFDQNDDSVQELLNSFSEFDYTLEDEIKQHEHSVSSNLNTNQGTNESGSFFSTYNPTNLAEYGSSSNAKRARAEFDNEVTIRDDSASLANGRRSLWVKDRSRAWWEQVNSPDFPEEEFKKAFRMSKATFDMICDELEPVITKKDTMLRLAIPVRQRVAVCVWRLATGEALREVSKRFGTGIATCHKLLIEVCTAIGTVLMPKFLHWPDENKMREINRAFEAYSGIPNVGGSIYTTHVPITAPKAEVGAYFNKRHTERNQKNCYSITVQGVVDCNGAFTDIFVGWPGSMTDEQVLEKSSLFQRANNGALKDVWVVGNSGYPLMDWILVPYTNQNLTWTQHAYNEKVEGIQKVAKEAFTRLKRRWKCLQKRTEMKPQYLPLILGACCVLHNICEQRNEGLSEELRFDLFDDEMVSENSVRSVDALTARDQIAHKILHHTCSIEVPY